MLCPFCATSNIQGDDTCIHCGADLAGLDLPEARRGFRGKLLGGRIGDMPLAEPIAMAPETTVREAVDRMRQARRGCVFVESHGELVGAFNERHLLIRVLRAERDLETTRLADVMNPVPVTLSPDDPPAFAVHCMVSRGLRHLPVVSAGELVGFLSVRTVLAYLHDELGGQDADLHVSDSRPAPRPEA